jgi:hypothetical protein
MQSLYDCQITDEQLQKWTALFVPEYAPYFVVEPDLVHALLRAGVLVYTGAEFHEAHRTFALEYGMVYDIWRMPHRENRFICYLSDAELDVLPLELQQCLFKAQLDLHRGHVYAQPSIAGYFLNDPQGMDALERRSFHSDGATYFVLTAEGWNRLPCEVQAGWVLDWINQWLEEEGESEPFTPTPGFSQTAMQVITSHVGRFAETSGANCFAAAVSPIVEDEGLANHLIQQWVHEGPMLRLLEGNGYRKYDSIRSLDETGSIQPEDILVWRDGQGQALHGAFAVGDGKVFNKWGQGWSQPWRILQLAALADYNQILLNEGCIEIYRK